MKMAEDCMSPDQRETLASIAFWTECVVATIVSVFGLTFNITSGFILSRKNMRHPFNTLLIALVIFDSSLLILKTFHNIAIGLPSRWDTFTIMVPNFFYPLTSISVNGSIYMVAAIAVERYRTLCHPSGSMSHIKKVCCYIIPVVVISILLDVPKFFELRVHYEEGIDSPVVVPTNMRLHPDYTFYYVTWFRIIAVLCIPLAIMMVCNYKIYRHVVAAKRSQWRPDNVEMMDSEQEQKSQESKLAVILMTIALTLFLCYLPRAILNIYEGVFHLSQECQGMPFWFLALVHLSHLLVTINSSINIFFYVTLNPKFRQHFFRIFWCFGSTTSTQDSPDRQELEVFSETEHYTQVEL